MNTEKMREEFEVWATASGISIVRTNQALMFANGQRRAVGDYIMVESVCAWAAWQAARATIKINLPSHQRIFLFAYTGQEVRDICIDELQAAGVAVESLGLESST